MPHEEIKQIDNQPFAKAAMLIRKPVAEVFEAFVDPGITARFWFSRGIGRLDSGKEVEWFWDQYGFSLKIKADKIIRDQLIAFTWTSPDVPATVELSFKTYGSAFTFVSIVEKGWAANRKDIYDIITGQTEGWTLVLASLKAWLEHNVQLNVVTDRHPDKSMPELSAR